MPRITPSMRLVTGARCAVVGASLLLSSFAGLAHAQTRDSRWSLEVSGDASLPARTLAGADLATGAGGGFNLRYRTQRHLSLYAGWEWHRFTSDDLASPTSTDAEETGYTFGMRFDHPLRGERLDRRTAAYWVRGGGTASHIELENPSGDIFSDTGHGMGWELGLGLAFPLGDRFTLAPGARYRSLARDLALGDRTRAATLAYVSVGIGVVMQF